MKALLATLLLAALVQRTSAQGFVITGQMHHTTIEGGCWYFQADDGKKYELWGDSAMMSGMHSDGATATFRVERARGAASICMMGDIVRVLQRMDTKRTAYDPNFQTRVMQGTVHRTKLGTWYLQSAKERWEFEKTPAKKYQNGKTVFHQRVTVLNDASKTKESMTGLIFIPKPTKKKTSQARPEKVYDAR